VFDSFSTDATCEIAREAGAEVMQHPFENYAQQRNAALDAVEADWVFFVDADERVTPELAGEIRREMASPGAVAYWIPRYNVICGHRMRGAGWYPDAQLRLLRRDSVRYERPVHEIAIFDGPEGRFENHLIHYNYATWSDFVARQRRYLDYDTNVLYEEGIRPKFYAPVKQALQHFWWRFVTLRGYRDGLHGLRICAIMARYEFEKYVRLRRMAES
jgi:hypothetical protein